MNDHFITVSEAFNGRLDTWACNKLISITEKTSVFDGRSDRG